MQLVSSRAFVGLAAALAWSAAGAPAEAKPGFAIVSLTPAQFLSNCQRMGGTHSMAPVGGLRCTLPSGTVVECSFTSDGQAFCNWNRTLPPKGQKDLLGDPLPSTMDPGTGKPKAGGADTAPGTVN